MTATNKIEEFLKYLSLRGVSQKSLKYYKSDIVNFLHFSKDRKIDRSLVTEYIETEKLTTPLSTLNRRLSTLRSYSSFMGHNYMEGVENVSSYKKIIKSWQDRILSKFETKPKIKNALFKLFFTRPNWYKKYHSYPLATYIHIAILILFTSVSGYALYDQVFYSADRSLAFPAALTRPNRFLSFQGRLTSNVGNPITSATNVVFKLYDASSGGTNLWDSGTCSITPDQDGIFSTLLGSSCGAEIASSVFSENAAVWVGVTVGADAEATPRIQIATVAYALNSETLQGFPAGTGTSTIPYINSAGTLVLANASPKLQSTSGTFAVEGLAMTISTPNASDGVVTINPDGVGTLDLTFEGAAPGLSANGFVNATNANITSGSLYSGTVASNASGYNFINFLSGVSPTSKFSVDSTGLTTVGADLYVSSGISLYNNAVTDDTVEAGKFCTGDGETNCVTDFSTFATGTNYWTRTAGNISPLTLNDTISATTSASVALTLTQTGAFNAFLVEDQASDTTPFIINENGNVGIATSTSDSKLSIGNAGSANFTAYISNGDDYGLYASGNNYGVWGSGSSAGVYGVVSGTANGILGSATGTGSGVYGTSNNAGGNGVQGRNTSSGIGGYFTSASGYSLIAETGNVGIGDTTPDAPLDVTGDVYITDGLSLYETAVSDGTVEATQFCTGDGETNCVTDFSSITNYWTRSAGNISPLTLNDTISATTSAAVALTLTQTGAFDALLVRDSASDTTPFVIDQSGNVGIGTSTPSEILTISKTRADASTFIKLQETGTDTNTDIGIEFWQRDAGAGALDKAGRIATERQATSAAYDMVFYGWSGSASTDYLRIESGGELGIGTSGPDAKLEINSATGDNLQLTYNDADGGATAYTNFSLASDGDLTIDSAGGNVTLATGDILTVTAADIYAGSGISTYSTAVSDGTVEATKFCTGDGETNCVTDFSSITNYWTRSAGNISPLTLNDTISATTSAAVALTLTQTGAFDALLVQDSAGDTTPFVIDQSGNVGIGTTTPTALLDVAGTATVSGVLTVGNGTTNTIRSPYGPLNLNYKSTANTWGNGIAIQDITGNVGINLAATSTNTTLHVNGTGFFQSDISVASQSGIPATYNNTNVAPNPSFEVGSGTNFEGWGQTVSGGTITRISSDSHDGAYSMAQDVTVAGTGFADLGSSSYINVSPSTTYTLSTWAKVNTACGDGFYLRASWRDKWGNVISNGDAYTNSGSVTTSWALYKGNVTSPASAYKVNIQIFNFQPTNACTLYTDQISFRQMLDGDLLLTNNLGIGDSSPVSPLTVGSGDLFQVDANGDMIKIKNLTYSWPSSHTASGVLQNDGSGNLTWTAGSGATKWNAIANPDGAMSLTLGTNTTQFDYTGTSTGWTYNFNSVTNGSGQVINANGLQAGVGLQINSTSTAGTSSGSKYLILTSSSGINANASHSSVGIASQVTNTGTTSTNIAGYFSASGASNNYAAIFASGNVGVGNATPTELLDVAGNIRSTTGTLQVGNSANTGYSRFGTATTAHAGNISTSADVLLEDLEVDGTLFLDGGIVANVAGTTAIALSATPTTTSNTLSSGNWTVDNTANVGQAALIINNTKAGDLFAASASAVTKASINASGDMNLGYSGVSTPTTTNPLMIYNHGTTNVASIDTAGLLTLSSDIAVNGGDITTTAATFNVADAATTLNMGNTAVTRTINLGTGTAADTINIGTGATTANTVNIATGAVANTIAIGSSSATTVSITDNNWSITAAGLITTADDVAINGGDLTTTAATFNVANAATTLNLGQTNVTRTINLGTGTNADTINIGTGATTANTVNIATGAVANTIAIGSSSATTVSITDNNWSITAAGLITTADDVAINGGDLTTTAATFNVANAATTLNLGQTNVTRTINLGVGTNVDTINIGTGATGVDVIRLGSATADLALTDANWSITTAGLLTTTGGITMSGSASNINLGTSNYLSGDGNDEGINIDANGHVGIGLVADATQHLWVKGGGASAYATVIENGTDDATAIGLGIRAGQFTAGTGSLIDFYDGDGTFQGNIAFNAGTVSYAAFTANHETTIPSEFNDSGYPYGTLLCIDNVEQGDENTGIREIKYQSSACDKGNYSPKVLGVYAGKTTRDSNLHQVYVLGDGQILVNGQGGDVKVGDKIATSTTAGTGMKANDYGATFGIAQEDYNFSSPDEVKLIAVQYGLGYNIPELALNETGEATINGNEINGYTANVSGNTVNKIGSFAEATVAMLRAGIGSFNKVETNLISPVANADLIIDLQPDDSQTASKLVIKGENNEEVASIDAKGQIKSEELIVNNDATISGTLYANVIESDRLDEIESLLAEVEGNQSLFAEAINWENNTATESASITDVIASNLFVTGNATINSLFVSENLTAKSLDSLTGPLNIQSLAIAPIEIMAGKIKIDTNGDTIFEGNVKIAGNLELDGNFVVAEGIDPTATNSATIIEGQTNSNSTAGKAVLVANTTELKIVNPKVKLDSLIYVTPVSSTENKVLYVKSKNIGEFVIGFNEPIATDVEFNWWIIELKPTVKNE